MRRGRAGSTACAGMLVFGRGSALRAAPLGALLAFLATLLLMGPGAGHAHAARHCKPSGGPGLIGYELLTEQGFTSGELSAVGDAVDRLARKVCPFPEFIDVVEGSVHQTHVHQDRVWKYVFAIKAVPGRRYEVTCLIPNWHHMEILIRTRRGRLLYRAGLRTEGL